MIKGFPYIIRPKEKLRRWGKVSDIQYAMRVNAERIFGIDPDSIVLAMPMWEGAGNNIIDYSKHGNHGSNNGATWAGQGLDFVKADGDSLNIQDASIISTLYNSSIKVRIKTDLANGGSDGTAIYCERITAIPIWKIQIAQASGTALQLVHRNDGGSLTFITGSASICDGSKHEVILTKNGTSVLFYIDGNLDGGGALNGNDALSTGKSRFGEDYYAAGVVNYDGRISSGEIFNITLSASQIALMNDRPWALYEPVQRPIYYFLPSVPTITGCLTMNISSIAPRIPIGSIAPSISIGSSAPRISISGRCSNDT